MPVATLLYRLKRPFHYFKTGLLDGMVSQVRYGFPGRGITIIAITGTDGKTTTSTLTYHLLKAAGYKVALLSTVGAFIGEEAIDTGFHVTSPQPHDLYAFLAKIKKAGFTHLVMEATSQGIYQYRTWGIKPAVTGLTNITPEHLDYHLTYDNYLEAKAELLRKSKVAFINELDQSFLKVRKALKKSRTEVVNYATTTLPTRFPTAIKARFPEAYNQLNARLAVSICQQIGANLEQVLAAIPTFPGVPGRKQILKSKQGIQVVIDFAHTPNALASILTELRREMVEQKRSGKLIAVFGCAGLRDRTKRPIMGELGASLADLAVFTGEDPRTENVWSIIRQMKEGVTSDQDKIISIADRGQAIEFALTTLAKKGDTVAILGKGHEQSMCYGKVEYPWSDEGVVQNVLSITS